MTPAIIHTRLLKARQHEVRRLVQELEFMDPRPANVSELADVLRTENEAIQAEILKLQRERERNAAY